MSADTHCEPSGSLGTGELPVPNITLSSCTQYVPSGGLGNGNIRGVVVWFNGFNTPGIPAAVPLDLLPFYAGTTFKNALVADGWIVLAVPYQETFYNNSAIEVGVQNDISNDPGFGSRYLASSLHTWDHIIWLIQQTYGLALSAYVVPFGWSWGAMRTLIIAANKPVLSYVAHEPATILSNVPSSVTTPVNFTILNTSGYQISATYLNAVTVPGVVGYGTNDPAVGWQNPGGSLPTSNTDAMITNATNAGQPVTRNATTDIHQFILTDANYYAGTYFVNVIDPLAPKQF